MQAAPSPYDCQRQPTFTETVLAQLGKWPWIEMVNPDQTAHNPSSATIELHSIAPDSSQSYDPDLKTDDPEKRW